MTPCRGPARHSSQLPRLPRPLPLLVLPPYTASANLTPARPSSFATAINHHHHFLPPSQPCRDLHLHPFPLLLLCIAAGAAVFLQIVPRTAPRFAPLRPTSKVLTIVSGPPSPRLGSPPTTVRLNSSPSLVPHLTLFNLPFGKSPLLPGQITLYSYS